MLRGAPGTGRVTEPLFTSAFTKPECGTILPRDTKMLRSRLEGKARFTAAIRGFFAGRGFCEVDTPILSPALIPEASLEVFETELITASGTDRTLYLAPSPELWMKRLISGGSGNIFQIAPCFRNGDFSSPVHNPEFRLLEWYEVGASYVDCIGTTEDLLTELLGSCGTDETRSLLSPPFIRLTMEEAFRSHAGIGLSSCPEASDIVREGKRFGLAMPRDPTWEEAFHVIFLGVVEPALPSSKPVVLLDYPAQIPTTAKRKGRTPYSERWELYMGGVEIANCYTEETDPREVRRFLRHEEKRKAACRVPHPTDRGFEECFTGGFPGCAGVALGVDRLEMAMRGEESLKGVILFPISAILGGQSGH
jgi:lysyl-tRNA synthetase class 2